MLGMMWILKRIIRQLRLCEQILPWSNLPLRLKIVCHRSIWMLRKRNKVWNQVTIPRKCKEETYPWESLDPIPSHLKQLLQKKIRSQLQWGSIGASESRMYKTYRFQNRCAQWVQILQCLPNQQWKGGQQLPLKSYDYGKVIHALTFLHLTLPLTYD